jgi:hypothetical protein
MKTLKDILAILWAIFAEAIILIAAAILLYTVWGLFQK